MVHQSPIAARLVHENLWVVRSHAYGLPAKVLDERFEGDWRFLGQTLGEAEVRADRALAEMATQLRMLDDAEGIAEQLKESGIGSFGSVVQADGSTTELYLRDLTNKILHSSRFEWVLSGDPIVVSHSVDGDRWIRAEINVVELLKLGGILAY